MSQLGDTAEKMTCVEIVDWIARQSSHGDLAVGWSTILPQGIFPTVSSKWRIQKFPQRFGVSKLNSALKIESISGVWSGGTISRLHRTLAGV